jgi:branched-chain amino acid transport system permease protein
MNLLLRTGLNAALPIVVLVLFGAAMLAFAEPYQIRVAYAFFMNLVIAIGLQVFMGNTGVVSFGHVSFMGIAAYTSSLLTIPLALKKSLIPNAPFGLATVHLDVVSSIVVALLFTMLVAWLSGLVLKRVGGAAAEILTLALLVISFVVFNAWIDLTRGPRSLYGIPVVSNLSWAMAAAAVAIFVAKLFRDSDGGLQLRASSENLLAARAMGVPVESLRLRAWVISAALVGVGGILHATYLGTIGPNSYYFTQTFLIMAMVILGGMRSVSGAIVGTALISVGSEAARTLENGPVIFGSKLPEMFGLTGFFLGTVIVLCMTLRRDGILGDDEFEDILRRRRLQKTATVAAKAAAT